MEARGSVNQTGGSGVLTGGSGALLHVKLCAGRPARIPRGSLSPRGNISRERCPRPRRPRWPARTPNGSKVMKCVMSPSARRRMEAARLPGMPQSGKARRWRKARYSSAFAVRVLPCHIRAITEAPSLGRPDESLSCQTASLPATTVDGRSASAGGGSATADGWTATTAADAIGEPGSLSSRSPGTSSPWHFRHPFRRHLLTRSSLVKRTR